MGRQRRDRVRWYTVVVDPAKRSSHRARVFSQRHVARLRAGWNRQQSSSGNGF